MNCQHWNTNIWERTKQKFGFEKRLPVCVLSRFSHVWLSATLWTAACRLLCPWDSPGKSTVAGCHFLLQEIFATQGSNLCLLCLPILAGRFFTTSTTWETPRRGSIQFSPVQFSRSVMSTPCNPMNCSTPGPPVHHKLPEFTQTRAHQVSDAIQPSHPLSSPSPPAPSTSQHQGLFQWVNFTWGGPSIGVPASASDLPMNTQDWSPLGWTGWISSQSKDSQEPAPTSQFRSINSSALSFLHSPTLTSIHDHWRNHSLD